MKILAQIFVAIVIIEHLYFLYLEMFAWETSGKKAFKGSLPDDMFKPTKTLAANQGLYNGFLAAGLIWTFFIEDHHWKFHISIFFLCCIIVAGIFGGITASKKNIFYPGITCTDCPYFIASLSRKISYPILLYEISLPVSSVFYFL